MNSRPAREMGSADPGSELGAWSTGLGAQSGGLPHFLHPVLQRRNSAHPQSAVRVGFQLKKPMMSWIQNQNTTPKAVIPSATCHQRLRRLPMKSALEDR